MLNALPISIATFVLVSSCTASAADSTPVNEPTTADASQIVHAIELSVWNDPNFRRQFAQSYMAETDIEPRVTESERTQMQKAMELIAAEKMDDAIKLLEKQRSATANAVFDFTLANISFQRDDFDQAAALYESAVEKFGKFRRAYKNLALIRVRQNDYRKALPALTRVIELGGGDAVTYGLLGFCYANVENHISAESAYRMANLLDPNTMDWKMGLARTYFKQERFADAAALCRQLIAENPDRTDLWLLQANAYIGMNQPHSAAQNYEFVDRLGHSTEDSLNMLGDIYVNDELFELAVNCYWRAVEKSPTRNPKRALRAAKVLSARGAHAETLELITKLEQLCGDKIAIDDRKDLLKLRARIALATGGGEEEVRVLQEIIALDPLDGEALILLGQHSQRTGDNEQAAFYYERAANIDKHEADAKVRHAQLLVSNGKYTEALPLLRRAQAIRPRDSVQQYLEQVERVSRSRTNAN